MGLVTFNQFASLKGSLPPSHIEPSWASLAAVGIKSRANDPAVSSVVLNTCCDNPNETSSRCGGKAGENSLATLLSGRTSPRYSPPPSSWKLACSWPAGSGTPLPEANTSRNRPGASVTAGHVHLLD